MVSSRPATESAADRESINEASRRLGTTQLLTTGSRFAFYSTYQDVPRNTIRFFFLSPVVLRIWRHHQFSTVFSIRPMRIKFDSWERPLEWKIDGPRCDRRRTWLVKLGPILNGRKKERKRNGPTKREGQREIERRRRFRIFPFIFFVEP